MAQTVFVKVVGFTDVERHALNTVFRLSEQRDTRYCLWADDAPAAPQLALVDGLSYGAPVELESPGSAALRLIWVGPVAPACAWRAFDRPIAWPEVVGAMDELFAPARALDFDLGVNSDEIDTRPPDEPARKRALIASADRDQRLYLRARLALADLTRADEAETGARALELTRTHPYDVALVDFALPDMDGWVLLKELVGARPAIPHVIATKPAATLAERWRARLAGAQALLDQPPSPGRLQDLLERV